MDQAFIKKYQKRAKTVAVAFGFPELAEDFSQELFIYFLEHPDIGATVDHVFIDYLRRERGRPGTPGGDAKIKARNNSIPIEEATDIAEPVSKVELSKKDLSFLLEGKELEVYQHVFLEEKTLWSLTEELGVTESRLSQILKEVKKKLTNYYILQEGKERLEWNENFGVCKINWIKI